MIGVNGHSGHRSSTGKERGRPEAPSHHPLFTDVCVQQTVLGFLQAFRKTYVVRDALGSRRPEDKKTTVKRMERHGAEIVTTEMVVLNDF